MSRDRDPATGLNAAVAAELRAELAARGWSQKDLASASGVPQVSSQRYLKPSRHIDTGVLEELAEALDLSPEEVMLAAVRRLDRERGNPLRHLTAAEVAELDAARTEGRAKVARSGHARKVE